MGSGTGVAFYRGPVWPRVPAEPENPGEGLSGRLLITLLAKLGRLRPLGEATHPSPHSEIQTCSRPDLGFCSKCSAVWVSWFPGVQVSGCPGVQGLWVSGRLGWTDHHALGTRHKPAPCPVQVTQHECEGRCSFRAPGLQP